jgi:hypothetical protein
MQYGGRVVEPHQPLHGLIKLLRVDPTDLHRARRKGQGKLVVEIMSHYEKLPKPNRSVYYTHSQFNGIRGDATDYRHRFNFQFR